MRATFDNNLTTDAVIDWVSKAVAIFSVRNLCCPNYLSVSLDMHEYMFRHTRYYNPDARTFLGYKLRVCRNMKGYSISIPRSFKFRYRLKQGGVYVTDVVHRTSKPWEYLELILKVKEDS